MTAIRFRAKIVARSEFPAEIGQPIIVHNLSRGGDLILEESSLPKMRAALHPTEGTAPNVELDKFGAVPFALGYCTCGIFQR